MAGRDDRHLSMRARNATTRLTEYTATRVRYKARYIRKSSHTVRSGSSVHWGPEQFTRLAAGTGTSLARRQFVSLPRKQTVSSLLVTYPNIQGRRCRYASRHRTHHSWPRAGGWDTETANTEHARTQRDHTHISIERAAWQVGMIVT